MPPPNYLFRPAAGIDISDQSVKYAVLRRAGRGLKLQTCDERAIPLGVIESGKIRDQAQLVNILTELKKELGTKFVIASLPEEQAFIVDLQLPFMPAGELRQAIEWQLEEHVPLPIADAVFDYETVTAATRPGEHFKLAVSVFAAATASDYAAVCAAAGLAPLALEVEAQAIVRAITPARDATTFLVVDIGKTRTSFFVTRAGRVVFSSTIGGIGGEIITHAVAKNLGLERDAAEELKTTHGLLRQKADERLLFALAPLVSVLKDEINKLFNYWGNEVSAGKETALGRVVLSGGQATLPGLVEYFAASLPAPVSVANVWTRILDPSLVVPPLQFNQAQKYATALGLALRQFSYD